MSRKFSDIPKEEIIEAIKTAGELRRAGKLAPIPTWTEVQQAMKDPEVMEAMKSKNYHKLMNNLELKSLMEDAEVRELFMKMNPRGLGL